MNSSWSKSTGWLFIPAHTRESLIMVLATIYLVTVFAAIIRLYLLHSFLVEVECKETLAIILF